MSDQTPTCWIASSVGLHRRIGDRLSHAAFWFLVDRWLLGERCHHDLDQIPQLAIIRTPIGQVWQVHFAL